MGEKEDGGKTFFSNIEFIFYHGYLSTVKKKKKKSVCNLAYQLQAIIEIEFFCGLTLQMLL